MSVSRSQLNQSPLLAAPKKKAIARLGMQEPSFLPEKFGPAGSFRVQRGSIESPKK
jgi:hypothetical protein